MDLFTDPFLPVMVTGADRQIGRLGLSSPKATDIGLEIGIYDPNLPKSVFFLFFFNWS